MQERRTYCETVRDIGHEEFESALMARSSRAWVEYTMWIVKTRPNRPACFHNPPGVFAARPEPLIGLRSARFLVHR